VGPAQKAPPAQKLRLVVQGEEEGQRGEEQGQGKGKRDWQKGSRSR